MKSLEARVADRQKRKEEAAKEAKASGTAAPTDDGDGSDAEDYNTWTVEELKAELKNRELPTTGNKADLVAALEENDAS